jgi:hypothetical protein
VPDISNKIRRGSVIHGIAGFEIAAEPLGASCVSAGPSMAESLPTRKIGTFDVL